MVHAILDHLESRYASVAVMATFEHCIFLHNVERQCFDVF